MEFVDLGLSVKWATCNIGASNPEDYGYEFPNEEGVSFTDTNMIKLPTEEQAQELIKECTWEMTSNSYKKYSWKVIGKNGKFILLPASFKESDVEWRVGNYLLSGNNYMDFGKYGYGIIHSLDVKCNIRPIKVKK